MVHVRFNPHSLTHYQQIGFGQVGYGPYFEGLPYQRGYGYQRGLGIGSLFSGLLRYLLPLVSSAGKGLTKMAKSGAKTVGKEALITGARILDNVAQGTNLKDAVITETKEGARRVKQKIFKRQTGSGVGKKRKRRKAKGKVDTYESTYVRKRKSSYIRKSKKKTKKAKKKTKAAKKRKGIVGAKVLKTKAIKRRRRDVLGFY